MQIDCYTRPQTKQAKQSHSKQLSPVYYRTTRSKAHRFQASKKKKTSHSLFTKANRYRGKKKKTEQHIAAEQKQYDRVKALLKQQDAPREKRKQKKKAKTIRAQSGNELEKKKLGFNAPQLPLRWKSQQRGRTRQ